MLTSLQKHIPCISHFRYSHPPFMEKDILGFSKSEMLESEKNLTKTFLRPAKKIPQDQSNVYWPPQA